MNITPFTPTYKFLASTSLVVCCAIVGTLFGCFLNPSTFDDNNGRCSDYDDCACPDGIKNGYETDVDCGGGGYCGPCEDGKNCREDDDCYNLDCSPETKTCNPAPTCTDGRWNGYETDVDCGGQDYSCNRCSTGTRCESPNDCITGFCDRENHICAPAPTCSDGILNGSERDVDCGFMCPNQCPNGSFCMYDGDCVGIYCDHNQTCQTASCSDGIQNGYEGGVDCGYDCEPCPDCTDFGMKYDGGSCTEASECCSGRCVEGTCCTQDQGDLCFPGASQCCGSSAICIGICATH